MINEGNGGRIFEVAKEGEFVWDFVSQVFGKEATTRKAIYRAHRIHYERIPPLEKPQETSEVQPDLKEFRVSA